MIEPFSPGPLVAAMAGAVALAALGHLIRVRILVALGVMVVFAATCAIILGGFVSYQESPGPAPDPLRGQQVPPEESVGESRSGN